MRILELSKKAAFKESKKAQGKKRHQIKKLKVMEAVTILFTLTKIRQEMSFYRE